MKVVRKLTILIVVAALVSLVAWSVYEGRLSDKAATASDIDDGPLKVVAEPVGVLDIVETVAITGTIEPLVSVEVIPEVSGRLERLSLSNGTTIEVGVSVKAKEVIAVLERDLLDAAVHQAQAALQTAKANLEAGKVTFEDAKREKKRIENLYQAGAVPEQQYDAARTAYERAKAGLLVADANVKQAEAALAHAMVTLNKATIEAPITGVISKKYVDEGDMVGPGKPLLRIVQIETVKVIGGVAERYLRQLEPDRTKVTVKTDAYPEDEFQGTVYRLGVAVDPVTRTGEVEIRVPNPDMRLKPGMFARMTIVLQERQNVVVVPDSALIREQDRVYVFVANSGKAHRREIKLGLLQSEYYEVLEGLSPSELVITRGHRQIEDGQAVEVIQEVEK